MQRETTILLTVVLALVLIGILMVYSASTVGTYAAESLARGDAYHYLQRQVLYAALGLLAMYVALRFDYHHFRNPILLRVIVFTVLTLLVVVLIPGIGVERGGARRWLQILGFTFQPSEFAKIGFIILLAVKLSENQAHIREFRCGFLPPVVILVLFAGLICLERDLGMPLVIGATAVLMAHVAGARWTHISGVLVAGALVVTAALVTTTLHEDSSYRYRLDRWKAFADPWKYSDDEGFHIIQSFAAFAQGSIWGRGPGASEQKLAYLPAAHTDFIFAVWGEEMGLVGSLVVVGLFITVLIVGFRIALRAPDLFGALLAGGAVGIITFQAAFNMAVTTGLVPTKGLPLPFISAGGSALIATLTLVGVLLNVGLQAGEPNEQMHLTVE